MRFKRDILNDALFRTPDGNLYHYTDQAGLLGIIREKTIWATHTQHLNDQREFRHALEVFRLELNAAIEETSDQGRRSSFQDLKAAAFEGLADFNVCIASFSEVPDSLSQWRAYGGENAGFALGVPGDHLRNLIDREDHHYLAPCVYDEVRQGELMMALIDEVTDENLARPQMPREEGQLGLPPGGLLWAYLLRFAPLLKHPAFSGEREWRIITRPRSASQLDYRPGKSMILPFYRYPLEMEGIKFRLSEVVVGPTPHPDRAVASVKSFLSSRDFAQTRVRISEAPYRNW